MSVIRKLFGLKPIRHPKPERQLNQVEKEAGYLAPLFTEMQKQERDFWERNGLKPVPQTQCLTDSREVNSICCTCERCRVT